MSTFSQFLKKRSNWVEIGLPALTIVFGMQTIRTLLPLFVYVLRERMDWNTAELGLLAFAIFLTSFLAAPLRRLLGPRWMLMITAGGLGLLRLAIQIWSGDPLIDLYLAIAATILFILFLPIYLGHVRARGAGSTGRFSLGLLLGLALDIAIHGAYGTYDVSWQNGIGSSILILVLVLVQWAFVVWFMVSSAKQDEPKGSDGGLWPSIAWLAIGPFLFLQMLIFANIARLASITGWSQPLAFGWVLLVHIGGLGAALWMLGQVRRLMWSLVGLLALALFILVLPLASDRAPAAALFLIGHITTAMLMTTILAGLGARVSRPGLLRTSLAHGLGMILLVFLIFLYYGSYDLALPFKNTFLPPAAALILGLCALGAAFTLPAEKPGAAAKLRQLGVVLILILLPLFSLATWRTPPAVESVGFPVRVMTYNLHNGFDTDGHLGMEALIRVIKSAGPDVLALQEVSRGWIINGSFDMLSWLSVRLNMPYVYGPTADPLWGNAILSRYPIIDHRGLDLPPRDLPLLRGFLWARIEVGEDDYLDIITTHFHHIGKDSEIRVGQSKTILDFWGGAGRTVFLGDLNGVPDDPEIEMLAEEGLFDALDLAAVSPGYTYKSVGPYKRIDYIWLSPDLKASKAVIPQSNASDHLGVAITIGGQ